MWDFVHLAIRGRFKIRNRKYEIRYHASAPAEMFIHLRVQLAANELAQAEPGRDYGFAPLHRDPWLWGPASFHKHFSAGAENVYSFKGMCCCERARAIHPLK